LYFNFKSIKPSDEWMNEWNFDTSYHILRVLADPSRQLFIHILIIIAKCIILNT
jgi:hypothetical protein